MAWKGRMTAIVLAALAVLLGAVGFFLPSIRDLLVFQPRRQQAEAAVMQLGAGEIAMRRRTGQYVTFAPPRAAVQLRALGVTEFPSQDFLFDASLMPDKSLRLRALPRADSVRDLRVSPQMFVAELAPAGGIRRSGWSP